MGFCLRLQSVEGRAGDGWRWSGPGGSTVRRGVTADKWQGLVCVSERSPRPLRIEWIAA